MKRVAISPNPDAPAGNRREVEYLSMTDENNSLGKKITLWFCCYTFKDSTPEALEITELRITDYLETKSEEQYNQYWDMILSGQYSKQDMFRNIILGILNKNSDEQNI